MHFTERGLASLTDPGTYWDPSLRAFGVRVGKRRKTFIIVRNGARTIVGYFPHTTLHEARKKAKRLLLDHAVVKPSLSLEEALDTYTTAYIEPNYRPLTAYRTKRLLQAVDRLGKRSLASLTPTDFTDILDRLAPSQANHVFGALRTFFNWCEKRDYCASPLRKLTKPNKEKSRSRVLTDNELRRIWHACPENSHGKVVKLLILMGQRVGETKAIRKDWIATNSIENGNSLVVTFPTSITKNGQQHTIPIPALALGLIGDLSQRTGLIFPSNRTGELIAGWGKLKPELDKASGVSNWTLHDLRRTWATRSAELGTAPHIIEAALNHLSGTISPLARTYNRAKYQGEIKTAMDAYDTYISRLIAI